MISRKTIEDSEAAVFLIIGIHEIIAQEKRVLKGWFPENPKRSEYYARKRKQMGF